MTYHGRWALALQHNILPPSSGSKKKTTSVYSSNTLVIVYHRTRFKYRSVNLYISHDFRRHISMKTASFIRFQVSWLNVLGSNIVLPDVGKDRTAVTCNSQALQEWCRNGIIE